MEDVEEVLWNDAVTGSALKAQNTKLTTEPISDKTVLNEEFTEESSKLQGDVSRADSLNRGNQKE